MAVAVHGLPETTPKKFTMKAYLVTAFLMIAATLGHAQEAVARARSVAVFKDPRVGAKQIWIVAADQKDIAYYLFEGAQGKPQTSSRAEIASLNIFAPEDYIEAVDLYEGRKYEAAQTALAKVAETYKRLDSLPNSPGILAGYYEMECLRKLGRFDDLRKKLQSYNRSSLTLQVAQQQLELYVLWDAARAKLWQKVEELAAEYEGKKLTGPQRAQVAYCLGMALEGLDKPKGDVLIAYQKAITSDAGASEIIARDAALRMLNILHADKSLQAAKSAYDESNGEEKVKGYTLLVEAAGLATLYEQHLGLGKPLDPKFRYMLRYKPERE